MLEKTGNLAFFDDRDASYVTNFDLDGCFDSANCEIIGLTLQLKNRHKSECKLKLTSEKAAKRW